MKHIPTPGQVGTELEATPESAQLGCGHVGRGGFPPEGLGLSKESLAVCQTQRR